jgi:hypothetical protein
MGDFDLHQWFSDDELERCPSCGEQSGIRLPESGSFLCLTCGHVHAAKRDPAEAFSPTDDL